MKKMSKMVEEQPIISGELLSNHGLWVLLSDKAENLGIFDPQVSNFRVVRLFLRCFSEYLKISH